MTPLLLSALGFWAYEITSSVVPFCVVMSLLQSGVQFYGGTFVGAKLVGSGRGCKLASRVTQIPPILSWERQSIIGDTQVFS
jgi:hypothetical protein